MDIKTLDIKTSIRKDCFTYFKILFSDKYLNFKWLNKTLDSFNKYLLVKHNCEMRVRGWGKEFGMQALSWGQSVMAKDPIPGRWCSEQGPVRGRLGTMVTTNGGASEVAWPSTHKRGIQLYWIVHILLTAKKQQANRECVGWSKLLSPYQDGSMRGLMMEWSWISYNNTQIYYMQRLHAPHNQQHTRS